jgi:hypothetical protein
VVWGNRERGATLVEAAFILPFLLLLTFGVFTVARALQVNNAIDHAVREAARYGATVDPWVDGIGVGSSAYDVRSVVDTALTASAIPIPEVSTVCIDLTDSGVVDPGCGAPSIPDAPTGTENVVVRVHWPNYELNFLFFTVEVDLTGTAVSRWEG